MCVATPEYIIYIDGVWIITTFLQEADMSGNITGYGNKYFTTDSLMYLVRGFNHAHVDTHGKAKLKRMLTYICKLTHVALTYITIYARTYTITITTISCVFLISGYYFFYSSVLPLLRFSVHSKCFKKGKLSLLCTYIAHYSLENFCHASG